MEADSMTSFHRLYGDWNGDRTVNAADQSAFAAALGQSDITALATFDLNRDGQINAWDQKRFDLRMGRTV